MNGKNAVINIFKIYIATFLFLVIMSILEAYSSLTFEFLFGPLPSLLDVVIVTFSVPFGVGSLAALIFMIVGIIKYFINIGKPEKDVKMITNSLILFLVFSLIYLLVSFFTQGFNCCPVV